jgi:hypothetical protein
MGDQNQENPVPKATVLSWLGKKQPEVLDLDQKTQALLDLCVEEPDTFIFKKDEIQKLLEELPRLPDHELWKVPILDDGILNQKDTKVLKDHTFTVSRHIHQARMCLVLLSKLENFQTQQNQSLSSMQGLDPAIRENLKLPEDLISLQRKFLQWNLHCLLFMKQWIRSQITQNLELPDTNKLISGLSTTRAISSNEMEDIYTDLNSREKMSEVLASQRSRRGRRGSRRYRSRGRNRSRGGGSRSTSSPTSSNSSKPPRERGESS